MTRVPRVREQASVEQTHQHVSPHSQGERHGARDHFDLMKSTWHCGGCFDPKRSAESARSAVHHLWVPQVGWLEKDGEVGAVSGVWGVRWTSKGYKTGVVYGVVSVVRGVSGVVRAVSVVRGL